MKLKTELEITPEEALKLIQYPQYDWLQSCIGWWHKQYNPMALVWPYNTNDTTEGVEK